MTQQYALREDFEERIYRFLNKYRGFDHINFGIRKLDSNWLQIINKNAYGDVTHRLWRLRYSEDNIKELYQEFDLALRNFSL